MIFQLSGAPAHRGLRMRNFVNTNFPDRWIGWDGPPPCPPWSPDMTSLNIFLWGFVKTRVFRTPVNDIPELRDRITEVFTFHGGRLSQDFRGLVLMEADTWKFIKCM